MSFLVFIIIMTIWLSGLRSKKAEFTGDWTGRYPLIALTTGASAALKSHIIICTIVQYLTFQCVVEHLCWEEKALPLTYLRNHTVLVTNEQ